ncbi:Oidioi.mRNA.OKI2018_I69.chr2.g6535.t1.cds [Oikopleura dioica]|uniref:Oidioi.mRNA.OKI2018_I69.chr2.g6535.t1.cds n=1 Tax=Oikopleura dioica TaxID=34765 RepID=A0ABN7T3E6_OIKDI|nr:Oidioi.mRNA.OKI2018_I69.chr2.g6535.t1.cds [Oikopleura dioica]
MSTTTSTTVIESTAKLIEDTTTVLAEVLTSSTEGESSDWRVGWYIVGGVLAYLFVIAVIVWMCLGRSGPDVKCHPAACCQCDFACLKSLDCEDCGCFERRKDTNCDVFAVCEGCCSCCETDPEAPPLCGDFLCDCDCQECEECCVPTEELVNQRVNNLTEDDLIAILRNNPSFRNNSQLQQALQNSSLNQTPLSQQPQSFQQHSQNTTSNIVNNFTTQGLNTSIWTTHNFQKMLPKSSLKLNTASYTIKTSSDGTVDANFGASIGIYTAICLFLVNDKTVAASVFHSGNIGSGPFLVPIGIRKNERPFYNKIKRNDFGFFNAAK